MRFFALAVLGFLFATYAAEPLHFGRSDNSAAYLGFLVVVAVVFAGVCRLLGGRHPYRPLAIALAITVVGARRRPARGRAPRAQLRVRLLGHRRHPSLRSGQHHVLAAHRGRAAARVASQCGDGPGASPCSRSSPCSRARCSSWPRLRSAVTSAPPSPVPRASACSCGCCSARPSASAPWPSSVSCSWSPGSSSGSPTTCARATSRRTSAASSTSCSTGRRATRSSPSGASSTPTWRRSAAPSCCGSCPWSRCWSGTCGACAGGRIRSLYRSVPVIRQTVLALGVVALLGYALNDSGVAIPAVMALVFECAARVRRAHSQHRFRRQSGAIIRPG